ncbi:bifunctional transcriptional activator/DNA repair enzyme AdaA [Halobacillus sp. Marseille-Q1614]|uniref:bifunctional transcriptional activator/DNA repair enzyme AdaA n=1 Tax=Halobacillus sp. Marseille-Q1614 TaxID=2709134 RepID=UPI00156E3FDD|nr:trifunctional transcriptional activator/DNA repair protein Ada/methylated-DNA--[protein]-cysteine S-methyltransferase [Halobacillus sp. Marseille-Q1614]
MLTLEVEKEYYQALLDRKAEYEGVFFAGVKTTGVFCRPTCPARKPKFENCEFFETAEQALLASFRPCRRCRPLSHPDHVSEVVRTLVDAVEKEPEKRWKDEDLQAFSIDPSTARRQFKKRFGMTFVEYSRARRMGMAFKQIRSGHSVIDTQITTGYESSSGFRDAFSNIMGAPPGLQEECNVLKASWIDTKLGPMVAVADDQALYLLEFVQRRGLEREIELLRQKTKSAIIPGSTKILHSIEKELTDYFEGSLTAFKTPIHMLGSPFQQQVWNALREIPAGVTRSYAEVAASLEKPSAYRAVASANGANQLAIIIPCHRVINSNGELGGYGGGLPRKRWMIQHERKIRLITEN